MSSLSRSDFRRQVQQIDPERFEQFVADIWSYQGWKATLTSSSRDRGIDIVAARDGVIFRREAIQVKRYQSQKVSSREIQQYASIPLQEDDIDTVIIVTSGSFSQPAQEIADDLNVKTVDCDDLYSIVTENRLIPSLSDYIQSAQTERTTKTNGQSQSFRSGTERNDNDERRQFNQNPPKPAADVYAEAHDHSPMGLIVSICVALLLLLVASILFP